ASDVWPGCEKYRAHVWNLRIVAMRSIKVWNGQHRSRHRRITLSYDHGCLCAVEVVAGPQHREDIAGILPDEIARTPAQRRISGADRKRTRVHLIENGKVQISVRVRRVGIRIISEKICDLI